MQALLHLWNISNDIKQLVTDTILWVPQQYFYFAVCKYIVHKANAIWTVYSNQKYCETFCYFDLFWFFVVDHHR